MRFSFHYTVDKLDKILAAHPEAKYVPLLFALVLTVLTALRRNSANRAGLRRGGCTSSKDEIRRRSEHGREIPSRSVRRRKRDQ